MRLACVFVPQLALQAVLRRCPELRGSPVAIHARAGDAGAGADHVDADRPAARRKTTTAPRPGRAATTPRVVALSVEARRAGARLGMTVAQAAATCPALSQHPLADADVDSARAALGDLGYSFAPRIEQESARVFFEVGDLGRLYPGEAAIAQAIQARAIHLGLGVRVAIAGDKATARIATRAAERVVIPDGGAATFLAPLPLRTLALPDEAMTTFARWGLGTLGGLAALPIDDVVLRLGTDGARWHRLARGADDELFTPVLPRDAVEEGIAFDDAVAELEPLSFVLRGIFDRLLSRLGCRGLACAGITLRLQLETRSFDVRPIHVAAPTRETTPLLQLARLDLARRPPDAPITGVLVLAEAARARVAQLDLLRPAGPAPDRLAATIARLAALVGPENVGAPHAIDTWREEAIGVAPFALEGDAGSARSASSASSANAPSSPRATASARPQHDQPAFVSPAPTPANENATPRPRPLTIRHFRPPEEVEVMLGRDGPTAVHGKSTVARILIAAGPYHVEGEWWKDAMEVGATRAADAEPVNVRGISNNDNGRSPSAPANTNAGATGGGGFSRDYWDIHASDGAVYRLHHDCVEDRWFLDGYYD